MNKKGSHVSFAIAFIIFITFIIFLFAMVRPLERIGGDQDYFYEILKDKIVEEVFIDVTKIRISNSTPIEPGDCYDLSGIESMKEYENFFTRGLCGENSVPFNKGEKEVEARDFVIIYTSKGFFSTENPPTCKKNINYKIGYVSRPKYMFETQVQILINEHNENYTKLKERWNIPESKNFAISLIDYSKDEIRKDFEGNRIETDLQPPFDVSVYVKNIDDAFYTTFIDRKANLYVGFIKVSIW